MRRAKRPLDENAIEKANDAFYANHPELVQDGKRIPLSASDPKQTELRTEWMDLYIAKGGEIEGEKKPEIPKKPDDPTEPCKTCTVSIDVPKVLIFPIVVCACTGGTKTATVTATGNPGGGTFTWTSSDPSVASVLGIGGSATVIGISRGTASITVTYDAGGCNCSDTVDVLVVEVKLSLKNSGKIVPSPENEDYADEKASTGGTDDLGPLPMGQGRGDFPDIAYTSPIMVVGKVAPTEAKTLTFRWKRLITRRSWNIRKDAGGTKWVVTQRSRRGFPDDDTGADNFNDPTPSATDKIYIYDCSGLLPGTNASDKVGDFIREEKDFTYQVERDEGGTFVKCAELSVGQIIIVKRKDTTGTVKDDWEGVENSNAVRKLNAKITEAEVRSMVGGALLIEIDAIANH